MSGLEIVNEALVRVGAHPISSFNDASAEARATSTLFASTSRTALADFPWSFALRERELARLATHGDRLQGQRYTYQLPADVVRVLGLCCLTPFRLAGDQLYTDAEVALLAYVADVPPSAWSADFRRLMVLELAAAMAIAITDSANRADLFYREARLFRARARSLDSQQTPAHVLHLTRMYAQRSHNPGVV